MEQLIIFKDIQDNYRVLYTVKVCYKLAFREGAKNTRVAVRNLGGDFTFKTFFFGGGEVRPNDII